MARGLSVWRALLDSADRVDLHETCDNRPVAAQAKDWHKSRLRIITTRKFGDDDCPPDRLEGKGCLLSQQNLDSTYCATLGAAGRSSELWQLECVVRYG